MKTTTKILIAVTVIQILSAMGFVVWLSTTRQPLPEQPGYVVDENTIILDADTFIMDDEALYYPQQPVSRITVMDNYGESRDIILSDSTITVSGGLSAMPGEAGQLVISVEEL